MRVVPPPISLIKNKNYDKWDKYCVKIKLRRYATSAKSDLQEFKMALFDNANPEELFLFIGDFKITLKVSVTLAAGAKIQYLCTLIRGK